MTMTMTQVRIEATSSDVLAAFRTLVEMDPKWRIESGIPEATDGWIRGADFRDASRGPFQALLQRMCERAKTQDRKTMAASFALRFGWAGSVAIGPYLTSGCVPHVGLDNVSIKFRDTTLFERTAVHEPRGWRLAQDDESPRRDDVSSTAPLESRAELRSESRLESQLLSPLLRRLRDELHQQAEPVVRALYDWSGFAPKGSWGMITSSWAAQFITVCERLGGQQLAGPVLDAFFVGGDEVARMRPLTHAVSMHGVTHLYQRRASCCRYYLLPQGNLCASCPLVSHEERLRRNHEFMERQLAQKQK